MLVRLLSISFLVECSPHTLVLSLVDREVAVAKVTYRRTATTTTPNILYDFCFPSIDQHIHIQKSKTGRRSTVTNLVRSVVACVNSIYTV